MGGRRLYLRHPSGAGLNPGEILPPPSVDRSVDEVDIGKPQVGFQQGIDDRGPQLFLRGEARRTVLPQEYSGEQGQKKKVRPDIGGRKGSPCDQFRHVSLSFLKKRPHRKCGEGVVNPISRCLWRSPVRFQRRKGRRNSCRCTPDCIRPPGSEASGNSCRRW